MENDKSPRVHRGGSWYHAARNERVAYRGWCAPAGRYYTLGLRFFHFVSDLELLASSTIKLQKV